MLNVQCSLNLHLLVGFFRVVLFVNPLLKLGLPPLLGFPLPHAPGHFYKAQGRSQREVFTRHRWARRSRQPSSHHPRIWASCRPCRGWPRCRDPRRALGIRRGVAAGWAGELPASRLPRRAVAPPPGPEQGLRSEGLSFPQSPSTRPHRDSNPGVSASRWGGWLVPASAGGVRAPCGTSAAPQHPRPNPLSLSRSSKSSSLCDPAKRTGFFFNVGQHKLIFKDCLTQHFFLGLSLDRLLD